MEFCEGVKGKVLPQILEFMHAVLLRLSLFLKIFRIVIVVNGFTVPLCQGTVVQIIEKLIANPFGNIPSITQERGNFLHDPDIQTVSRATTCQVLDNIGTLRQRTIHDVGGVGGLGIK